MRVCLGRGCGAKMEKNEETQVEETEVEREYGVDGCCPCVCVHACKGR